MKLSALVIAFLALSLPVSSNTLDDSPLDEVSLLQTKTLIEESKESLFEQLADFVSGKDASLSFKKAFAEFIAMTLFVTISCGSAMSIAKKEGSAWVLQVALTFGLCITALAYSIGHYSGGQINCAVTFGLVLHGSCTVAQGICNFVAQMLGSTFGALILSYVYPEEKDCTQGLATNAVADGFTKTQAFIGEVVGTFLLMYVVFETAIDQGTKANRSMACVAIGLAVFLAHSMLIPIDGCSINPTRTFGPALVAKLTYKAEVNAFRDMWVFWAGPLVGAGLAALVYNAMSAA